MTKELEDAIINLDKKKILEICAEDHINIPADEKEFWCNYRQGKAVFR